MSREAIVAEPELDFERLRREEFPIAAKWAYLDHAVVSPMPSRTALVNDLTDSQ